MIETNPQADAEMEIALQSLETNLDLLPFHWHKLRLGEVCSDSKTSIDPQDYPDELFEYYSIPAFQDYNKALITKGLDILSIKLVIKNNTVLFGKLNPRVLKVWFVDSARSNRKIASTEFIPLYPNERVDSKYIYYLCQSQFIVPVAQKLVSGSTPSRQRVDTKAFFQIPVPIPPLPEQRAIAHILQTVQNTIQARCKELELERERKAALMQHLFMHGARGEVTKQTEIGEIPESWDVVRLEELLREPLKNGHSAKESDTNEGVRTLTLTAVTQNKFSLENTKLTVADPGKVQGLWLKPGDIFIERANTSEFVGLTALYDGAENFAIYPDLLIRVRLKEDIAHPRFIAEFLLTTVCRSYFRRNARGTAGNMPKIDHGIVRRTPISLPALIEQQEIAAVLQACDSKIAALEKEITLQEELFRALLEELMSGRLSALPLVKAEGGLQDS